jgi:hypothetical protein
LVWWNCSWVAAFDNSGIRVLELGFCELA